MLHPRPLPSAPPRPRSRGRGGVVLAPGYGQNGLRGVVAGIGIGFATATLKLQGRTLYVLENQADYGIDFVKDAKAVVRQPVNDKMKTTAYSSVFTGQDHIIDALLVGHAAEGNLIEGVAVDVVGGGSGSSAVLAPDVKEFRGIITAVLNGSGVAEWVVFYSDTNVDTLNDANVGQATMDVQVNVQLRGGR